MSFPYSNRLVEGRILLLTMLLFMMLSFSKIAHSFLLEKPKTLTRNTRIQQNHQFFVVLLSSSSSSPNSRKWWSSAIDNDHRLTENLSLSDVSTALLFLLQCFGISMLWIAVEDYTGHYTLPSRQGRSRVVVTKAAEEKNNNEPSTGASTTTFGQVTVSGMGFGQNERELLLRSYQASGDDSKYGTSPLNHRRSYNEIMLEHRTFRVPRWRKLYDMSSSSSSSLTKVTVEDSPAEDTVKTTQNAIHTLLKTLQSIPMMQKMAQDYQWDELRKLLQSSLLTSDLEVASSQLRAATKTATVQQSSTSIENDEDDVIGFDWASCAWRGKGMCGALADAQEALDELDARLGLLEPYEVVFCLDIVERSLRDMLNPLFIGRDTITRPDGSQTLLSVRPEDVQLWRSLPTYQPLISHGAEDDSHLDDDYLKAIQDLRVDEF